MLLPAGRFHDRGDSRALRPAKQSDYRGLLGIGSRSAVVRFLRGGGFDPAFAADRTLYLARTLTLGHFGIPLFDDQHGHRAGTTTAPRRPNGAGGEKPESANGSGRIDHTRSVCETSPAQKAVPRAHS